MDLDSCLVSLCNSFTSYKDPIDKVSRGFFQNEVENTACLEASTSGHIDLVQYYIRKLGGMSNYAMNLAAKRGYLHIVKFLISIGAMDINWGMEGAVEGGYLNIVKFFLRSGMNHDFYMHKAVYLGHIHIIKFFIEREINLSNEEMIREIKEGSLGKIVALIDRGFRDWDLGRRTAIEYNHPKIEELFSSLLSQNDSSFSR